MPVGELDNPGERGIMISPEHEIKPLVKKVTLDTRGLLMPERELTQRPHRAVG